MSPPEIPDGPGPEWQPGDVVADWHGGIHVRCEDNDGWLTPGRIDCRKGTLIYGMVPDLFIRGGKSVRPTIGAAEAVRLARIDNMGDDGRFSGGDGIDRPCGCYRSCGCSQNVAKP